MLIYLNQLSVQVRIIVADTRHDLDLIEQHLMVGIVEGMFSNCRLLRLAQMAAVAVFTYVC